MTKIIYKRGNDNFLDTTLSVVKGTWMPLDNKIHPNYSIIKDSNADLTVGN